MLRMIDLRSYGITKTYSGGVNFKEHIHSGMSACGSFVFCGTEYGSVNVWSSETGPFIYSGQPFPPRYPIINIKKGLSNYSLLS